jgi:hypothetical protein
MADHLGTARCPVCSSPTARASLMKTGRVCITCNACHVQVMSRGDDSDQLMRDLVQPRQAPAAELPAAPAPAPAPKPARQAAAEPAGWGLWP